LPPCCPWRSCEEHDALNDLRPALQDVAGKMRQDYSDRKQAIADLSRRGQDYGRPGRREAGQQRRSRGLFTRAGPGPWSNIIRWTDGESVNPTLHAEPGGLE